MHCGCSQLRGTESILTIPGKEKKIIRLHTEVHNGLDEVGFRGETYNDIVKRLIKHYKETAGATGAKKG